MAEANAPQIWGMDLSLSSDGDLMPSSSGDLSLISSIDNVKQAIINRLKTEVGSLAYDTTYGINLDLLIGQKNTPEITEILRLAIIQTLQQEPRILTIDQVQVASDKKRQDVLYVGIVVTPIASQDVLSLNLVYPYWTMTLVENIVNESATSLNDNLVDTLYDIYTVQGIWLSADTGHTGTNFYLPNGSYSAKRIGLGTKLSANFTNVLINYTRKITPTQ